MNSDTKLITKLFFRMVPVQILLVVISGLNSVIDSSFASNMIGDNAMAITGLFLPFNKMLDAVNALMFGGAQILCGRYLGKNMISRTRSVFTLDIIVMCIVSGLATLVCVFMPGSITTLLGASAEYRDGLISYIRGVSVGILPFFLASQLTAFLQLEQQEKRGYAGIVSMLIANALFNYLFIGVFGLGLFGLGLATSLANWIFFIVLGSYYFAGKATIRFDHSSIIKADLLDILKYGLPSAISQICLFTRAIIINRLLNTYAGGDGLKAYAAINTFGCIYWAVPAGVTAALLLLASVYSGEQDVTGLSQLLKTFLKKGVGLVAAISIVFMLLAVPLTNIFYHDPASAVYKMTQLGFLLFPISSPFSAITIGASSIFNLMKHKKIVNTLTVADGVAVMAGLACILVPLMGINGQWISQILSTIITVLMALIFVIYYNKRFPTSMQDLLCLPEGFGVPEDKRMAISIKDMDGVINVSEGVNAFCLEQGINRKHSYYTALCVEEMAGNIVKHGFNDKKKHSIDIRISHVKDDIVISMKDNCRMFNPQEAYEMFSPEDITHNIGIRIVENISKSMIYQNTLGLNVLTIVI